MSSSSNLVSGMVDPVEVVGLANCGRAGTSVIPPYQAAYQEEK
jgi:hypothetical protein